ncbi:hypothetical protein HAX54_023519 [Datura stramonium]|uniref:Putative plant transposon protein domain-containing protein n=1 Tax=Datura stramonium TaxID=4076 RepID=A0ABS8UXW1_DATST|nr:hypothetical protein [Datura stramonium]
MCGYSPIWSPTGRPPVVLRESQIILRIYLPNTACWHKSGVHRCFEVQDRYFADGGADKYDVYPHVTASYRGLIHHGDLKFEVHVWLDFVRASLIPSQNTTEIPIEVSILIACIMDNVHINVGELIADQFKRRAKQQATSLPYPCLISMSCVRDACPLFQPLDRNVRADSVITFSTKIDKDAPAMMREKGT